MAPEKNTTIPIPPPENAPLLQSRGCTRGLRCKRCLVGTHENTRKRSLVRGTFVAMVIVWLYWSVLGHRGPGFRPGRGGSHEEYESCPPEDLIPWDGPSLYSGSARNIGIHVGEGNIASKIIVTVGDYDEPTVVLHANVSKIQDHDHHDHHHHHRHHNHDHDKLNHDENDHDKPDHDHGHHPRLYVESSTEEDLFGLRVWADHTHGRRRRHHHQSFCVSVEILLFLPASWQNMGGLSISGPVAEIKLHGLEDLTLDDLSLQSSIGTISLEGSTQARVLDVKASVGNVIIDSATAPAGSPLSVKATNSVGSLSVNVIAPELEADGESDEHQVTLQSSAGGITLKVRSLDEEDNDSKVVSRTRHFSKVPGQLVIRAKSDVGTVQSEIVLADGQVLDYQGKSGVGAAVAKISDNFLGEIQLKTDLGSAEVKEAEDSASEILFDKNTKSEKNGQKVLKDQDGKDSAEYGEVHLISGFGHTELDFF